MVYKKYIKRNGKTFGPYYYESYRENGEVKTRFVSGPEKSNKVSEKKVNKRLIFFLLAFVVLGVLILAVGFSLTNESVSGFVGFVINENKLALEEASLIISGQENEIINQEFDKKTIDLEIREPKNISGEIKNKNKNKRMDFALGKGNLRLYFDLLNYSDFVEGVVAEISEDLDMEQLESVPGISGNVIAVGDNETSNETEVGNESRSDVIEIDIEEIQEKVEELTETEIEEIEDKTVIEAEDFEIIVDETVILEDSQEEEPEYKWGYKVKLNDLNFMAKIDVTSDKKIKVYNENTLRIGNNLLSFQDLVDAGYTVRIESPALKIDVKNLTIRNITYAINVSEIDEIIFNISEINETEINITDINVSEMNITDIEINLTIDENVTEEIDVVEINESEIKIIIDENITEVENITEEFNESEINITEFNITETENITEIVNETVDEISENESESEESEENVSEVNEQEEQEVEQELESDELEEQVEEQESITGMIVKLFYGFYGITGKIIGIDTEVQDIEYENTVTVYIEKDFNGEAEVGDIVYLDPTLIILIIKAQHLDENREFLDDIYDSVKEQDDNWSNVISNNEYVRVTFEENLTSERDITIYARGVGGRSSEIGVYREDDNEEIARFEDVDEEDGYKIYLSNLGEDESYDTFDLRVFGEGVEFDYIVDPEEFAPNQSWNVTGPIGTAKSVAVDSDNNVYVTGYTPGSGPYNYTTIKYNSTGGYVWNVSYDDNNAYNYAKSIAVDNSSNVYVTGFSSRGGPVTYRVWNTLKYDLNGNYIWNVTHNSGNIGTYAYGITVDSLGNSYVTGSSEDKYYTIKYNSTGGQVWNATGPASSAYGITVDSSGNVYVTGTRDLGMYSVYFTIKYNSSGSEIWNTTYDSGSGTDTAYGIAVDSSENVYVTGSVNNGANFDYHTIKYNSTGGQLWNATYNGGNQDSAYGITVDSDNNVYVTGVANSKYYTIKYNSTGSEIWNITEVTGTAYGIAVDSSNNTYVTGTSGSNYYTIKYGNFTASGGDSINPDVNIIYPLNDTYDVNVSALNYTVSEAGYCWWNNGSDNSSIVVAGVNWTDLESLEGSNTWSVYCNDSTGNINDSESVTFFKDSVYPLIDFSNPTLSNNSATPNTNIFVNVSITEISEDTIIFSLYNSSRGEVNTTSYINNQRVINWTSLSLGIYYYNITVNDSVGNINSTETREIEIFNSSNITTCKQLQGMENNLGINYALGSNVSCSDTVNWNGGAGFQPVGDATNKFTGNFDGANHTIGNLTINMPSTNYVGLFGVVNTNSNVSNLRLININISGQVNIGGVVGGTTGSSGNLFNLYVTGSIQSAFSGNAYIGGLVGHGDGRINNSYFYGTINASASNYVGGLVGYTITGDIDNSYSVGNITGNAGVGGLLGYADEVFGAYIHNSFTNMIINNASSTNIGNLVGYASFTPIWIENCYWNNYSGGPGKCSGGGLAVSDCNVVQNNQSYFYNINEPPMANWSYPPWDNFCNKSGYPSLDWENIINIISCLGYTTADSSDSTPPTFDEEPVNQTIAYNTLLNYDLNASDETLFDSYTVNDTTNFKINSSGNLENNTHLGVDLYNINITINDSSNNLDSRVFWVNVTQIVSNVNLTLNNTQANITIYNNTQIDLNCSTITGDSGAYLELWNNGTLINNRTSPIGNSTNFTIIGDLNITCVYESSQNYSRISETWWVNVSIIPDTTPPTINITYPLNISYSINISTINYTISETTGKCWYSNDSGVNNYSVVNAGVNWTGVISKEGSNNWTVYCNDSSGNENSSSVSFSKDTGYPLIDYGTGTAVDYVNLSQSNVYVNVSVTESNPSNITFLLFNSTGQVNKTIFSMEDSNSNNTINWTGLIESNYTYNVSITDSSNNINTTLTRTITLDTSSPSISFSCDSTNVNAGEIITCSCSAIDNTDSSPDVSYTINPLTSNTGTYTTTCTTSDDSGNFGSFSIEYIVSQGGGGSVGSGGGSTESGELIEDSKNYSCDSYYWFDSNSKSCEYKQFCRLYMYYGLRTFSSLEECEEEFDSGIEDGDEEDGFDDGDNDDESEDVIKPEKKDIPPNWNCEEWSECKVVYNFDSLFISNPFLKGEQTRLCVDQNDNYFNKIEKKECDAGKPVIIEEDSKCVQELQKSLNVYELKENSNQVLVSRLNFVFQLSPVLNIDFSADENDYCDYCYDGVKNFNEDEVDCVYEGDSCPVCGLKENLRDYRCNSLYWFDSNSKSCEYKQFCGLYMYYGLKTFESLEKCEEEFDTSSGDDSGDGSDEVGDGGELIEDEKDYSCNSYYWFDSNSESCEYKQFCGLYMYYGLRTFESLEECEKEFDTKEDGSGDGEDGFDDGNGDGGGSSGGGGSSSGSSENYFYETLTEIKKDIQNYVEKEKPFDVIKVRPLTIIKTEWKNKNYILFLIIFGITLLAFLLILLIMLNRKIRRKVIRFISFWK